MIFSLLTDSFLGVSSPALLYGSSALLLLCSPVSSCLMSLSLLQCSALLQYFLLFWSSLLSPCRFLFTESLPPTSHLSSAHLCAHLCACFSPPKLFPRLFTSSFFPLISPFFYCSSSVSQLRLTPSFFSPLHFFWFILLTPLF